MIRPLTSTERFEQRRRQTRRIARVLCREPESTWSTIRIVQVLQILTGLGFYGFTLHELAGYTPLQRRQVVAWALAEREWHDGVGPEPVLPDFLQSKGTT